MIIDVTQEHINAGDLNLKESCPIALAFKAKGIKARVGNIATEILNIRPSLLIHDNSIRKFIFNFDHGDKVKPFMMKIKNGRAIKVNIIEKAIRNLIGKFYVR